MKVLLYNDLNSTPVKKQFDKTVDFLRNDDFSSAEIKKITNSNFYRAKLDYENRLLFKFAKYGGETYILILEVILNHAYEKSKFLNGAKVDETRCVPLKSGSHITEQDKEPLRYINKKETTFHLLDKVISFDDVQNKIFNLSPPVVIIGSAGSGKTVLTLEKIKRLKGNILYVTLSPFLVQNSSKLYFSNNYVNESQEIDFLSYHEFLETMRILPGKELDQRIFNEWVQTRKQALRIKDTHKLFEEFKGVLTGYDISKPYLSKEDYLKLGVKQTIFLSSERESVYEAFKKYLEFMEMQKLVDLNIISYHWLSVGKPIYDFIVIDEVQDFTNIQLYLILKSLKNTNNFILCGDSNQIVHPNFFSWTNVKTMFYKKDIATADIKILRTNYRNSIDITETANQLLMLKNARFGSLDKESTYLVDTISEQIGEVKLYKDHPKIRQQLNEKTGRSAKFAVLVMNTEDKKEAGRAFRTPLLFSIHEAKGLEYENIILVNFISNYSREFQNISQDISEKDLNEDSFAFGRARNKADKDLDAYKFYINALYVGITRAVKNLYIVESNSNHHIFSLLSLVDQEVGQIEMKTEVSSEDEWQEEARKLDLQGKKEQADAIRESVLSLRKPDWEPITGENIHKLKELALDPDSFNKREKDKLFAYALLYDDHESIKKLSELKYRKADNPESEKNSVYRKYYQDYLSNNVKAVETQIRKYGSDYRNQFNMTPLMCALKTGSLKIAEYLSSIKVNIDICDHTGRTPVQMLLAKAYTDPLYHSKLAQLYPLFITDYLKIKVSDRLIKLDHTKMEFFLVHFFVATQKQIVEKFRRFFEFEGVAAKDLAEIFNKFPENVLPEFRKRQQYISSMLSKNEVEGNNPYNRLLFLRTERGLYVLQPELEIMVEGKWKNVYEIIQSPRPKKLSFFEKELYMVDKYILDLEKEKKKFNQGRHSFYYSYMDEMIQHHKARKINLLKMMEGERGIAKIKNARILQLPGVTEEVKEMEAMQKEAKQKEREEKKEMEEEKKKKLEKEKLIMSEKKRKADDAQLKLF